MKFNLNIFDILIIDTRVVRTNGSSKSSASKLVIYTQINNI